MLKRTLLTAGVISMALLVQAQTAPSLTTGKIVYLDNSLKKIIPATAKLEVIASGLTHVEGPVWLRDSSCLLLSDTKAQIIYRWTEQKEISKFLQHTGFTGRPPYSEEPGSNGLAITPQGTLLICEHGDRRVATYPLNGRYGMRTLTDAYQTKRLNSPNDVVVKTDGSVYFTDPPYGLPLKENDPTREIPVSGVYKVSPAGQTELLTSELPYANGLAFSPDEQLLYVSNSDVRQSYIRCYPVQADGRLGIGRLFFDASGLPKQQDMQVTDGLKVDRQGNVWASGPGGLLIISPQGKLLGRVETYEVISNCAWNADCTALYLTAGSFLYRLKLQ